jgi:hypothetical protein
MYISTEYNPVNQMVHIHVLLQRKSLTELYHIVGNTALRMFHEDHITK